MSVVKFKTNFLKRIAPNNTKIPKLIKYARELYALGVLDGQSGNLSSRTKNGFVISCANVKLGQIKQNEFAEVFDIRILGHSSAQVVADGLTEPSSESPVHWAIYRLLPSVNTIFHIHDDEALEFARELGLPITSSFRESGTLAIMREVEKLIKDYPNSRYFLLRDHGAIVLGSNTREAFYKAKKIRTQALLFATRKEDN